MYKWHLQQYNLERKGYGITQLEECMEWQLFEALRSYQRYWRMCLNPMSPMNPMSQMNHEWTGDYARPWRRDLELLLML